MSSVNKKKKLSIFSPVIFLLKVFFVFTVLLIVCLFMFKWIDPPISAFIVSNTTVKSYLTFGAAEYKQNWVSFDEISPHFFVAVISSEDQRFLEHFGFDFKQIEKAIEERDRGRRVRGASTITQQLAKNLFLWSGKDFIRKGVEAYITLWMELILSKKRILELYANIVELGNSIYGVEAASLEYFNKPAKRLTKSEAALLAAILPYPKRYNLSRPTDFLLGKKEKIKLRMDQIGGEAILKQL